MALRSAPNDPAVYVDLRQCPHNGQTGVPARFGLLAVVRCVFECRCNRSRAKPDSPQLLTEF